MDIYGGNRVLGKNNARYVKLVQALDAIDDVQVNFREAGPGSEIALAIVRDPNGLMNQDTNSTGKPSARDAITKALAKVPTVRCSNNTTLRFENRPQLVSAAMADDRKTVQTLTGENPQITEEAVRVTTSDKSEAQEIRQLLQKTDALPAGASVIRGKLHDANGKPVPGATIDILGAFQYINSFWARDDALLP